MNNSGDKLPGGKFKFSIYWMYAVILAVLCGVYFFGGDVAAEKEV